jgi:hypothetical protein
MFIHLFSVSAALASESGPSSRVDTGAASRFIRGALSSSSGSSRSQINSSFSSSSSSSSSSSRRDSRRDGRARHSLDSKITKSNRNVVDEDHEINNNHNFPRILNQSDFDDSVNSGDRSFDLGDADSDQFSASKKPKKPRQQQLSFSSPASNSSASASASASDSGFSKKSHHARGHKHK